MRVRARPGVVVSDISKTRGIWLGGGSDGESGGSEGTPRVAQLVVECARVSHTWRYGRMLVTRSVLLRPPGLATYSAPRFAWSRWPPVASLGWPLLVAALGSAVTQKTRTLFQPEHGRIDCCCLELWQRNNQCGRPRECGAAREREYESKLVPNVSNLE